MGGQAGCVQVGIIKVDRGDLEIVVGGVIIDTSAGIAAAGVSGILKTVFGPYATVGHCHRLQNVKELINTFCFAFSGDGIFFYKEGSDKPGGAGKIAG